LTQYVENEYPWTLVRTETGSRRWIPRSSKLPRHQACPEVYGELGFLKVLKRLEAADWSRVWQLDGLSIVRAGLVNSLKNLGVWH
jgi:hypothetical protein